MANSPTFASTARLGMGQVTAANTNRDGTGTLVDILTGVAAGTKVTKVTVCATVTTTVGVVRLFVYDGANTRLLKELLVTAITPSTTVEVYRTAYFPDLILPSASHVLRASTHNAEAMNVFAEGYDLT